MSTDDVVALASVSNCGSADAIVRHDRWSSISGASLTGVTAAAAAVVAERTGSSGH